MTVKTRGVTPNLLGTSKYLLLLLKKFTEMNLLRAPTTMLQALSPFVVVEATLLLMSIVNVFA
jgi:hypothetical protein